MVSPDSTVTDQKTMTTDKRLSRDQLNYQGLVTTTLNNLVTYYLSITENKSLENFENEILHIVWSADDQTLEEPDAILEKLIPKQYQSKTSPMHTTLVACAYLTRAIKAKNRDESELAWSYLADARYWTGVTLATKGIEEARIKTIKATRSNSGRKAASARTEKYSETIQEAYRLARELRPKLQGWKSRFQAAESIKDGVLEFSKKAEGAVPLKKDQVRKTVYQWLKNMPDAEILFPATPKKAEKNKIKS